MSDKAPNTGEKMAYKISDIVLDHMLKLEDSLRWDTPKKGMKPKIIIVIMGTRAVIPTILRKFNLLFLNKSNTGHVFL